MKKMKLIIEVDKKYYEACKDESYPSQIEEIIANGTPYNPSGDLISREALKAKMFDIPKPKEGATFWDGVDTVGNLIDNSQAIEYSLLPLSGEADNSYMRGYEVGKAEGILKANTRPKGEWEEGTQGYYCSKCDYYDQSYFEHSFCPNCGADMRRDDNG